MSASVLLPRSTLPAFEGIELALTRLPAPLPIWHGSVDRDGWHHMAGAVRSTGGRLVSLWAADARATVDAVGATTDDAGEAGEADVAGVASSSSTATFGPAPALRTGLQVSVAYAVEAGLLWLDLALVADESRYPDLSGQFPSAARLQRAVADLHGILADGFTDRRPWLDHGAWTGALPPLRTDASAATDAAPQARDYPFVRVEGDGVHEIPVGPVHAGIIEPGHFRFSVVGEKVLRLEQRLGYTHKGIARRFTQLEPLQAHRLAGRVSGDSTVAFAWAYCMALESAAGCDVPERATWLRALMLERERVANHLGDLGALGNDAAFAFGLAQFSRLREDWLRDSQQVFAHRLMMDVIEPGGVAVDPGSAALEALSRRAEQLEVAVGTLRSIYDEHAGLQDRFIRTGIVTPELAAQLGLTGLAGRASAQAHDLRCDHAWAPYDRLGTHKVTHTQGDVTARVAVRFDEVFESLRLQRALCAELAAASPSSVKQPIALPRQQPVRGAGWVEGWRGPVFVALDIGADGRIARCHCHDPSWHNWPVLEHAVMGDIVPDFPLINKSFNLSYSGPDL